MYSDLSIKTRIERARSQAMRHPEFCLLSGIFMIGKVNISQTVKTACTDGVNTYYGEGFISGLNEQETNFLVLHEEGHKAFSHLFMYKHLHNIDPARANKAMDYFINGWIIDTDPTGKFAKIPEGGLYKAEWSNKTIEEIFKLLDSEDEGGSGNGEGKGGGPLDDHDWEGAGELTEEQVDELGKEVEQALREGQVLVGKAKGNIDRRITDMLQPKIDWREVLRDFLNTIAAGKDQASWRQFNRRYVAYDLYMPSTISECMGEIVIAVDTSGSIDDAKLRQVVGELVSLAQSVNPSRLRVLWWDTSVSKEQVIDGDMSRIEHTLEPSGGGGTNPDCVSKYIIKKGYTPEAIIVFTDGYFGGQAVEWRTAAPTLWIVDGSENFVPPSNGKIIQY